MTKCEIDGKNEEITVVGDKPVTNQVILDCISAHLREGGRAIAAITINGQDGLLSPDEPIYGDLSIVVASTEIDGLVRDLAADGIRFLEQLQSHIDATCDAFISGNNTAGHERITLLADGLNWFMHLAVALEANGFAAPIQKATADELNSVFSAVVKAQEGSDMIALADTLRHELKPVLAAWSDSLATS